MHQLRYPMIVFAALSLGLFVAAAGQGRTFIVGNSTTADTSTIIPEDAEGPVSCAGTLEAKCSGQSTWTEVGSDDVALKCQSTDAGIDYRAVAPRLVGGVASTGSVAWSCGANAVGRPAKATQSKQGVTITGTLSSCDAYALLAATDCEYFCVDEQGITTAC